MCKTATPFHNEAADQHRHPSGLGAGDNYSVIYDLRDDQISALRIYLPMSQLIEQITS
jgi:hypothetical protein